jgi:hypothetical protein
MDMNQKLNAVITKCVTIAVGDEHSKVCSNTELQNNDIINSTNIFRAEYHISCLQNQSVCFATMVNFALQAT